MFTSARDRYALGFAADDKGGALPDERGPWIPYGYCTVSETDPRAYAPIIHAAVLRDGYHVGRIGMFA
jgi:hypothetical protein